MQFEFSGLIAKRFVPSVSEEDLSRLHVPVIKPIVADFESELHSFLAFAADSLRPVFSD